MHPPDRSADFARRFHYVIRKSSGLSEGKFGVAGILAMLAPAGGSVLADYLAEQESKLRIPD